MKEKTKYILTIILGVVIIILVNILILSIFGKKEISIADFLGNWELTSTTECSSCIKLYDNFQIRGDNGCYIEDKQLKIPKRLLIQDYTIPTDEYYCFNLNLETLTEEKCKNNNEESTYKLVYEKSR